MAGKFTTEKVESLSPGNHCDGDGLWICVSANLKRSAVYQYTHKGRRREMGLGSLTNTRGLAALRAERDKWRAVLESGRDPIAVRNAE
jgi:hypothetical protein